MFTVFTVFVPAGLTLYILTNTVLGMLQQAFVNRQHGRSGSVTSDDSGGNLFDTSRDGGGD
jgi:membrane protein insertase Oxa1/YidC/SpoIIIJ